MDKMFIEKITNELEYCECLLQLEKVFDSLPGTPEGEEALRLLDLIEDWESKYYPI